MVTPVAAMPFAATAGIGTAHGTSHGTAAGLGPEDGGGWSSKGQGGGETQQAAARSGA
jgi:hypothetical protein